MKVTKILLFISASLVALTSCEKNEESSRSSEAQILEFSIGTQQGVIDQQTKTVTATLPDGVGCSQLSPSVTVSGKATVSPAKGAVVDFTSPVVYTITAEDGTTQLYTVSVAAANEASPNENGTNGKNPVITSVEPTTVLIGETITIKGENFKKSGNKVYITGSGTHSGHYTFTILSESTTEIKAVVPSVEGEQEVIVGCDGIHATAGSTINVLAPENPTIYTLRNSKLVRGVDDLHIIGYKICSGAAPVTVLIQSSNTLNTISVATECRDGENVVLTHDEFSLLDPGDYSVWLDVNGFETAKLSFTLTDM